MVDHVDSPFLTALRERVLIGDGAMGTQLQSFDLDVEKDFLGLEGCNEILNDTRPDILETIHRRYFEAGADLVETNTFGCNLPNLADYDIEDRIRELAEKGTAIARRVADEMGPGRDGMPRFVAGSIGPGTKLPSLGHAPYATLRDAYVECGLGMLDGGADCFLIETCQDLLQTRAAVNGVKEAMRQLGKRIPIIVHVTVETTGTMLMGSEIGAALTALEPLGIDMIGLNCATGPDEMSEHLRYLSKNARIPVSVMPNAGLPVLGKNGATYPLTAPDLATALRGFVEDYGLSMVGGCCGTTPEHIAQMTATLARFSPAQAHVRKRAAQQQPEAPKPNPFWDKLSAGKRVIAVEFDPPVDDNVGYFLDAVKTLRDCGADAVTLADCPIGRPRADSSLLACKVKRELGMESLPHMTCRDRNLNATKALLLGLSMEGVHNVLLVTGDPIPTEERDEVKSVFNFNSRKLARYVTSLNSTVLTSPFRVFGALDLNAKNFDIELRRAQEKEENGVVGFLTQPVLSAEALENLKRARETLQGKLLGGIFPVVSHRNACFLNNEISGMRVCDEIIDLYAGKDRDEAEALAVTISTRIAQEITPYTDGLYIMTPFRRVELIKKIIEAL